MNHPDPREPVATDPLVSRATGVFRAGFWSSLALLAIGVCLSLARSESLPSHLVPLDGIASSLSEGSPAGFITIGIVAMILTPVMSTLVIGLTFIQQRDRRYATLTVVVLVILLLSVSLSLR
ncbi:MAG: hypothetical protein AVDCRST_MAG87-225 [uncultured Thermomicrobiales bacterium]|uniref:DUF1634 domain-containing protein n=1 Tax=uncultured Thermomicrobiales bacterium TaxID=1645740 RepID=A0A6J4UA18_9BACT|nr:MAG: hypothetical protein AVDCRST_MAG87-225 [uncultured Thermomicrobiales bacterium]